VAARVAARREPRSRFVVAIIPAMVSAEDFLANSAPNLLALLLCVLIPWTAVNLATTTSSALGCTTSVLFERDGGRYGSFKLEPPFRCYFIGIWREIPVMSDVPLFTGFMPRASVVSTFVDRRTAVICRVYVMMSQKVKASVRSRGRVAPTTCRRRRHAGGLGAVANLGGAICDGVTVLEAGPSDRDEPRARELRRWAADCGESEYDLDTAACRRSGGIPVSGSPG